MSAAEALSVERQTALEALCSGTWPGTADMVAELVMDSTRQHGWRPSRAALARLVEEPRRTWMTFEEFATWVQVAKASALRLKLGTAHPRLDLEIEENRVYDLQRRARAESKNLRIRKTEALACAHYALGLPKPVENGDTEGFAAWFQPRFGTMARIVEWLDVYPDWLRDRLRGWSLEDGKRVDRKVEGYAIRALDWVYQNGPVCPYGDRSTSADVFPGQSRIGA